MASNTASARGNNYPSTREVPRGGVPQRKIMVGIHEQQVSVACQDKDQYRPKESISHCRLARSGECNRSKIILRIL